MKLMSEKDILNYAVENGIIDINTIQKQIEMNERIKFLKKHDSKVWQSTDNNWYTYLPDIMASAGRRLIKRKTKDALDDAIIEHYKSIENEPYMQQVFEEWIESKLKYGEIQKQSYDRYKTDFDRFFNNTKIYNVKFKYITEEMLEDFIKSTIHDRNLTAKAWSGLRILINGIFKFAKKKGYTNISITTFMGDLDISRKVFRKNKKTDEESVFTDKEVVMINDYINAREPSIIELGILLTFETGLRVGELSAITWSDINDYLLSITKTEIHYRGEDGRYVYEIKDSTKTCAGERKVILSDNAQIILKRIRLINPFGEYVFMKDNTRIRSTYFTKRLIAICKKIKIQPRSAHKMRKTYATKLINAGLSECLITEQLGHEDILTSKKYYYFNNKEREESRKQIQDAVKYG